MRLGTALVISAPSGAGKTTLVKKLLAEISWFSYSISCTTRAPRGNEVDGRDYHFMSRADFDAMRAAGGFAEWAEVHGNCYGTPLKPLREFSAAGLDVLLDVDVQGAAQLRNSLPGASFVFILPPSMGELERRLRHRGTDGDDVIARRLANARGEIACARWFDAVVVNDSLERAYDELRGLYLAAACRTALNVSAIETLLMQ